MSTPEFDDRPQLDSLHSRPLQQQQQQQQQQELGSAYMNMKSTTFCEPAMFVISRDMSDRTVFR